MMTWTDATLALVGLVLGRFIWDGLKWAYRRWMR
jgi:hypothetical protein